MRIAGEPDLHQALRGKRVLLTGYSGFKGGWMSIWLKRLGAEVVGVALPPAAQSFCNAVGVEGMIDARCGDIRSQADVDRALDGEDFDLIIHMAAQAVVRTSYAEPVDTYLTNVVGTAIVLEAARRMPSLRGAIVVTSDKCYDNREWVWGYRENDPMGGKDPYSSSKGCAELVAAAYRHSYFSDPEGPRLATVRAGNVIGGGDWGVDRLIPDLARAAETGTPARIRNPRYVRPWQHVLEALRGYLMLAAELVNSESEFAGAWNFGPDNASAVDVGTVIDLFVRKWGEGAPAFEVDELTNQPAESAVLRLDSTKAASKLGWRPVLELEEALEMTASWYRSHLVRPKDSRALSEQQIEDYVALWTAGSATAVSNARDAERVAECV